MRANPVQARQARSELAPLQDALRMWQGAHWHPVQELQVNKLVTLGVRPRFNTVQ